MKKHDPNKDYNVFWELLLSSPTPQFSGFQSGNACREKTEDRYLPDLDITLQFGKYDANQEGIKEIQQGILDFAADYKEHFKDFPYMSTSVAETHMHRCSLRRAITKNI